jgi:8-oxo-dGTP pyrophosphatase MutT (NUDIX family)
VSFRTRSTPILSPARAAVVLVFHKKLGLWLQPGGHIEPEDPTPALAALREVREEVGITTFEGGGEGATLFDVDVHPIPARPGEPFHEHFDLRFCFVAASDELSPSDEVLGARWVELTDLDRTETDESVRRAVQKLRALNTPRGFPPRAP